MTPTAILARASAILARRRRLGAALAVPVLALAGVLGLLLTDAASDLSAPVRRWSVVALAIATLVAALWALTRRPPAREDALRQAELAMGDDGRQLTAALQLAGREGELAQAAAQGWAAGLAVDRLPSRLPAVPWLRLGLGLAGVVALAVIGHLADPRLWPTTAERCWDPDGDHPPYARARLAWAAAPARVRVGAPARFEVDALGQVDAVTLRSDAGAVIAMHPLGGGRWAAELAGIDRAQAVWVAGGGTRTTRHALAVDPVPVLTSVDVRLESPAYADLPPEHLQARPGSPVTFAALPGSTLRFLPVANRPLAALHLVSGTGPAIRLRLEGGWAGIQDLAPGAWSVLAEATDAACGATVPILTLDARPDLAPRVAVVRPERDVTTVVSTRLAVELRAEDDLGLAQALRTLSYGDLPAPLAATECSGRQWSWRHQFDLEALGVRPGDVFTLGLVARDRKPVGGQWSEHAYRTIRVVDDAEYNRLVRARLPADALLRKYGALARQLSELEAQAAAMAAAGASDAQLKQLAEQARSLSASIAALRRAQPTLAIERDIQDELQSAAERLAQAAETGDASALPTRRRGAAMQRDLAKLADLARLQAHLNRLEQLADAEQNTASRLLPLAEHRRASDADRVQLRQQADDEATLAQGVEVWQQLGEGLVRRSATTLTTQAGQMADLIQSVSAARIATLKRSAAAAARAGDGPTAHRLAAQARDALLALLPEAGRCRSSLLAEGSMCLGWSRCSGDALKECLGLGEDGMGLGGAGDGGMGLWLAYGGDDRGGTNQSQSNDLLGPENLGDLGGLDHRGEGDGVAALAAGSGGPMVRPAATYRQGRAVTSGAARAVLGAQEQAVVDAYFRLLREER